MGSFHQLITDGGDTAGDILSYFRNPGFREQGQAAGAIGGDHLFRGITIPEGEHANGHFFYEKPHRWKKLFERDAKIANHTQLTIFNRKNHPILSMRTGCHVQCLICLKGSAKSTNHHSVLLWHLLP